MARRSGWAATSGIEFGPTFWRSALASSLVSPWEVGCAGGGGAVFFEASGVSGFGTIADAIADLQVQLLVG